LLVSGTKIFANGIEDKQKIANTKNIVEFPNRFIILKEYDITTPAKSQLVIVVTVTPISLYFIGNISEHRTHTTGPHEKENPQIYTIHDSKSNNLE